MVLVGGKGALGSNLRRGSPLPREEQIKCDVWGLSATVAVGCNAMHTAALVSCPDSVGYSLRQRCGAAPFHSLKHK